MRMSYEQINVIPGGGEGAKRSGKSTIIHCHYKDYESGF